MAKEVSFIIKINDNGSAKRVTADAEELGRAIRSVQNESERLKSDILTWSQASQAIDVLQDSISNLQGVMSDLTAAYQVQLVAETQLETIMRQRMNSTNEEIQGIKELCSAQQELGVIGDEVQLSGAQQMATFLNEKQSLDTLIPAMNNLIAQQNGLNATNQDAVSIGNMMGKAMQGQVEVLQRVGITFDEAQKQVLQFGTESERAAMLAEVITANVGNMNAELAKTDAGRQKQLENTLGDIKEQLGGLVQGAMPFVTIAAQTMMCVTSAGKFVTSLTALSAAFSISTIKATALAVHEKIVTVAQNMLAASGYTATAGTAALTVAVTALYAALTMGISVIVAGLAAIFRSMGDEAEDAAQDANILKESTDAFINASARMKATLAEETTSLRALIQSKKDTSVAIRQLNEKYGEVFGSHQTAAAWYDVLTQKSQAYVRQIGYEAQARELSVLLAKKEMELEANNDARKKLWQSGKAQARVVNQISGTSSWGSVQNYSVSGMADTAEYVALKKHGAALVSSISELREKLNIATGKVAEFGAQLNPPVRGGIKSTASVAGGSGSVGTPRTTPQAVKSATKGSIDWYEQELRELRSKISSTADESVAKGLQSQYKETESALEALKVRLGISVDTTGVQEQLDAASDHLTITADVEPEVKDVTKGSRWDKRMSYSNATSLGSRIQDDYDIGLIDKETAEKEISAINEQLSKLGEGLKPIELHVDEKSVESIRSLGHIDLTNMDSVLSSIKNLKQVTDPTAKGFATAGASCEALGSALQQLGGDSEAAKAGLVMAAIGNLVLSFSQALASCKTWIEWLAFGISGAAQLTNLIGMISGFATGGIVPGSQRQGDKVLVRVNSGEMILNQAQQARLFAIANGAALYGEAGQVGVGRNYGAGVTMNVEQLKGLMADGAALGKLDVRMKVKGRDLVGVVANETRQNRRRSNIKI